MYEVSQSYVDAIVNRNPTRITGTITLTSNTVIDIDNSSILAGSLYTSKKCISGSDIELGSVNIGEMGVTILDSLSDRRGFKDAKIKLYFEIQLASGSWETVPLGIYYVTEALRPTPDTLKLTGFDSMSKFDKEFKPEGEGIQSLWGTPYTFLELACNSCGVEIGVTTYELSKMPNRGAQLNYVYGVEWNNDIATYRDLVSHVSSLLGGFAYINREGKLKIRSYATLTTNRTIDLNNEPSAVIQDYTKKISGLRLDTTSPMYGTRIYIVPEEIYSDGTVLNILDGPLFRFRAFNEVESFLNPISDCITEIEYTPSEVTIYGDPAIDVGDVIEYTGRSAGNGVVSIITKSDWKYRGSHRLTSDGTEFQTETAGIKSSSQKQMDKVINIVATTCDRLRCYTKPEPVYITPRKHKLFEVNFTTKASDATPLFSGQLCYEMKLPGTICIEYSLDGEPLKTVVKQHAMTGYHTADIYLPFTGINIGNHKLEVYISCDKGYGVSVERSS